MFTITRNNFFSTSMKLKSAKVFNIKLMSRNYPWDMSVGRLGKATKWLFFAFRKRSTMKHQIWWTSHVIAFPAEPNSRSAIKMRNKKKFQPKSQQKKP